MSGRRERKPFWKDLTVGGMMAIVAALSLLFAAVSYQDRMGRASREAARRAQCTNNLTQIGLALELYASSNGSYPPGSIPNLNLPPDRRLGWMYASIPFLDLPPSFAADHPDLAWDDPAFSSYASSDRGRLVCPAGARSRQGRAPIAAGYIGIAGLGVVAPDLPKGDPRAGFFGNRRVVTRQELTDGASTTMIVVDSTVPAGPWFAGGRNTVRGLDPSRLPYVGQGRQFGGSHSDHGLALMGDGSVRVVSESIDPRIFEAMSTIAGGEIVANPPAK